MMVSEDATTELRFKSPRAIVDVLDAVSLAQRKERTELVNEVLQAWADDRRREAEAVMRITSGGRK